MDIEGLTTIAGYIIYGVLVGSVANIWIAELGEDVLP